MEDCDRGFAREGLLPEEKSEIETLFNANFYTQASLADYEARKNLLKRMGFTAASINQMINEMMGSPHTEYKSYRKRHTHNWVCFHLLDHPSGYPSIIEGGNCNWGSRLSRYRRKTLGRYPFQRILHWELWDSKLSQLKLPISRDHAQMIVALKKHKLFSSFGVLAHPDAFKKTHGEIPYLIYGNLWNVLLDSDKVLENKSNASMSYPLILVRSAKRPVSTEV